MEWDVFISHAHEDKDAIARPLFKRLQRKNLNVWFDEFTLKMGDSLRESIDKGLANSRFGLVILSPMFFQKNWTKEELNGLVAAGKRILPVWHEVDRAAVANFSPTLADKKAIPSSKRRATIVQEVMRVIGPPKADITAKVSALIGKIQAGEAPLSCNMLEALELSRRLGIESLERFCLGEIKGWDNVEITTTPEHRCVDCFASYYEINTMYMGWGDDMNNAFTYMRQNPKYFRAVQWPCCYSIYQLETKEGGKPKSIGIMRVTKSRMNPDCHPDEADKQVIIYMNSDTYPALLRSIKESLIRHLVALL